MEKKRETTKMGYMVVIGLILGAMINKPNPFKGLDIKIPIIIPIKKKGVSKLGDPCKAFLGCTGSRAFEIRVWF